MTPLERGGGSQARPRPTLVAVAPRLKYACTLAATLLTAACAGPQADVLVGLAAHPAGHQGAALAAEDLRAQGVPIRLREASRDEAFSAGPGAVALAQAYDAAGVVAVVGHSSSAATLSAAHILNQRGVPLIVPNSTSPLITGIGRWVFRICATDRVQGAFLADHAFRKGYRRAAILYILDDYGKGLAASFARAFSQHGGQVVLAAGSTSFADRPSEDLAPALKALRAARPDVLFLASRTRDVVRLSGGRLLAEPGWPPLIGGDAAFSPMDTAGMAGLFEGMTVTIMSPPTSPAARRFAERYRQRFGTDADNASYACYDAVTLAGLAIRESGATREAVRRYLRRLGRDLPAYEGVMGPIRFDESGDALDAAFTLAQVRKGTLEVLSP